LGLVVAVLIVTIARVTAADEHTASAVQQRLEDINGSTAPLHIKRITRTLGGYWMREVSARSAPR
jgi:hypothetical protein